MLTLHTSNQLEQLSEQFAHSIKTPLKTVFAPELVVVQNSGMARYLSLQVADKNSICANTDFLFPAEFMWQVLKSVIPNIPEQDPTSPFVLRWRLLDLLISEIKSDEPNDSDIFDEKSFPELAHYLANTDAAWDLSQKLADTLDKILFYRDDWVRDWEGSTHGVKNTEEVWQARLWKKLITENQLDHWLSLQDQFITAIHNPENRKLLPERVSFFSLSALSPGYIRLLGEMGKVIDINLFIINPCPKEYWGDIESEKSISKKSLEEQPYYDLGNALLASMGRQGRDFIDQLQDLSNNEPKESFIEQTTTTLLQQIQNDVLALNTAKKATALSSDDDSIQFYACHTAMREVEVLHDQLLSCLDNSLDLAPSDIIVMMPDIEKYAPYIEAVFSSKSANAPKLPFSIADQNPAHAHPTIEAFLKVLDLVDKRFDAESVFELLDYESIREQFNLKEDEVIFCREIARATNIRWGISAESRKRSHLPNTDEHTWRYALDRVLLGYALPGDDLFNPQDEAEEQTVLSLPLLPYSEIEGTQAIVISNLIQFIDVIFKLEALASQMMSIEDWLEQFNQFITSLFADESQNKVIFNALDKLRQQSMSAEFGTTDDKQNSLKLPFSLVTKILKQSLQEISGHESFMGYGITFCALVPMRSVPFKVVALLGMNDGEFPRQDHSVSFDLVAQAPRKGDRSRRDEDRYLFLESILASRQKLIISYIGQSVKDNTALPPSVLVSELLDEVCIYTDTKIDDWICKHPLQAFSPRYYNKSDKRLFSYKAKYSQLKTNKQEASQQFITKPLEPLAIEKKQVHLDQLIRFFQSPARVFLQERFSISNFDKELELPIREPFEVEVFKDREIRQQVLQAHDCLEEHNETSASISDAVSANIRDTVRAKGLLPYGEIGDKLFDNEVNTINQFVSMLPEIESQTKQPFIVEFSEGFTLQGELNNITEDGRIIRQVGKAYARDYISLWLNHLVLNTQQGSTQKENRNEKSQSSFYSPELSFKLLTVENAHGLLEQILKYYWQGLHFPLPFYLKPAYKQYADKQINGGLKKAKDAWSERFMGPSEKEKFENWLLYRGIHENDLFNDEYQGIAELIFGELYKHYEEI